MRRRILQRSIATSIAAAIAITGSSALVSAAPVFVTAWGTAGSGPGQFGQAEGIALDDSFHVYVVDHSTHRIEKFGADGEFLLQWGGQGTGPGQFSYPSNVAVDDAFNVYVTDTGNNRVEKFNSMGVFLTQWGGLGSLDGQFHGPLGIAVDAAGSDVYVVDPGDVFQPFPVRIERFTSSGAFLSKWGTKGCCAPGQLFEPSDVAVSSSDHVYVIDSYSGEVQEFTSSGAFVALWGGVGVAPGRFQDPAGIEVDRLDGDRVYVADSNNQRVQVFGPGGTFLELFGTTGSDPGQFLGPGDVAVDRAGFIYVTDSRNHRVQKFLRSDLTGVASAPHDGRVPAMTCVPNPCRERVEASFQLARPGVTRVEVFDASGRRVRCLSDGPAESGPHSVVWNLRDGTGARVAPGIYLLRVSASADRLASRLWVLD